MAKFYLLTFVSDASKISEIRDDENESVIQISDKNSLIWFSIVLAGQEVPAMLDTGANPNCISQRCVLGSEKLRNLERYQYAGKQILDANGQLMEPLFVIRCSVGFGSPIHIFTTEFVVIKSLPFSCIIGQTSLRTFSTWEVSNQNKLLTINKKHLVPFFNNSSEVNSIDLITTQKSVIEPFKCAIIDVKASGPELGIFRPTSNLNVLVEGVTNTCERLSIEVVPSVNVLTHQNCQQKVKVYNLSGSCKTIAKGVKLAKCSSDYDEYVYENSSDSVNLLTNTDPIEMLCSKLSNLNTTELSEARTLLNEFRDVFSVSNNKIGRTNVVEFDVDKNINPVTVPLRRVPMHHKDIVQTLLTKYEELHLIEPINSPFRAPTVLVRKKNNANSSDITDQYRICTDYRILNNQLSSSGWPAPSLDECLDAIGDANMFSSIDFNSGYHQIPCTTHAKQVLAFSSGYGFKQFTWSVMPQGVKTASSCFQQGMLETFNNHETCILPPYYDDVIIKSRGFRDHLQNVRTILHDVRKAKFTLNVLKCSFFQKSINYLGHVISENSIHIDPNRVKAIVDLPVPKDVKGLRSFIVSK